MDLDQDGRAELVSGNLRGTVNYFKRQSDSSFAASNELLDQQQKPIQVVASSTVFAGDLDGDGDLDLLLGDLQGQVSLCRNEGNAKAWSFAPPIPLEVEGKPIRIPGGDSHPIAADWDGDGTIDLLCGSGTGDVSYYRNLGTNRQWKLARGKLLIQAGEGVDDNNEPLLGMRSKIAVADWNGDGRLDLLVGDFSVVKDESAPPPAILLEEAAEPNPPMDSMNDQRIAQLQRRFKELDNKIREYQRIEKLLLAAPIHVSAAADRNRAEKLRTLADDLEAARLDRLQTLSDLTGVARPENRRRGGAVRPYATHGFVRVFLRQTSF